MSNSRGKEISLREKPASTMIKIPQVAGLAQIAKQRRITELELIVQRLQHRLRIFEGLRAIEDDVELVDENQIVEEDETKSDGGILPHHRKVRSYLRRDQPKEHLRELLR